MLNSLHTRHPVFSGKSDNIKGAYVKDLLRTLKGRIQWRSCQNRRHNIASDAYFIPETTLLFDQLQAFRHDVNILLLSSMNMVIFAASSHWKIFWKKSFITDDEHDIDLAGLTAGGWLMAGRR